jgi:hypothetical protein
MTKKEIIEKHFIKTQIKTEDNFWGKHKIKEALICDLWLGEYGEGRSFMFENGKIYKDVWNGRYEHFAKSDWGEFHRCLKKYLKRKKKLENSKKFESFNWNNM